MTWVGWLREMTITSGNVRFLLLHMGRNDGEAGQTRSGMMPLANSPAKWHADNLPGSHSFNIGTSAEQTGRAIGQRGWKGQPGGGAVGLGGSPLRWMRPWRWCFREGTAERRARV